MQQHQGTIQFVAVLFLALFVNIVLDQAFGMPMLLRWGIAIAAGVTLTLVIEVVRKRSGRR